MFFDICVKSSKNGMDMWNNKPVCKKISKVARLTEDIPLEDLFTDLTGLSTLFLFISLFFFCPFRSFLLSLDVLLSARIFIFICLVTPMNKQKKKKYKKTIYLKDLSILFSLVLSRCLFTKPIQTLSEWISLDELRQQKQRHQ